MLRNTGDMVIYVSLWDIPVSFNSPVFSYAQGSHITDYRLGNSRTLGGLGGQAAWKADCIDKPANPSMEALVCKPKSSQATRSLSKIHEYSLGHISGNSLSC